MMINAEEEKQLLNQLGVVESTRGAHYPHRGVWEAAQLRCINCDNRHACKVVFSFICLLISIHSSINTPVIVMLIMQNPSSSDAGHAGKRQEHTLDTSPFSPSHTHTHTHTEEQFSVSDLMFMFLHCGRKLEKTHTDTGRTCKLLQPL